MKIKPVGNKVLVEPLEAPDKSKGGLFIPDAAKQIPQEGIVRAVGTGEYTANGTLIPIDVKEGDKVLISKYGGTEVKVDGKAFKIVLVDEIIAILGEVTEAVSAVADAIND